MTGGVIFTSLVILDYEELCAVDNIVITGKKKNNLQKQFLVLIAIFQNISKFLKHDCNFIFKIFSQQIFFTLLFLHSYDSMPHTLHFIPVAHLFCNWKFVTHTSLSPISFLSLYFSPLASTCLFSVSILLCLFSSLVF